MEGLQQRQQYKYLEEMVMRMLLMHIDILSGLP
jgi:hypothetical protein